MSHVTVQWCGKHISAAVNQHTMEEVMFSVVAALRLCNEDLRQLRDRIERVSRVGSWQNN
jgi:hypothetical protein